FGSPQQLTILNTTHNDTSPSLTADGLTLYFNSDAPDGSSWRVLRTTRPALDQPFGAPSRVTELEFVGGSLLTPSISPDGRELYFAIEVSGSFTLHRSELGAGQTFGPPVHVIELDAGGDGVFDPFVTPDRHDIFMIQARPNDFRGQIRQAHRHRPDGFFAR